MFRQIPELAFEKLLYVKVCSRNRCSNYNHVYTGNLVLYLYLYRGAVVVPTGLTPNGGAVSVSVSTVTPTKQMYSTRYRIASSLLQGIDESGSLCDGTVSTILLWRLIRWVHGATHYLPTLLYKQLCRHDLISHQGGRGEGRGSHLTLTGQSVHNQRAKAEGPLYTARISKCFLLLGIFIRTKFNSNGDELLTAQSDVALSVLERL